MGTGRLHIYEKKQKNFKICNRNSQNGTRKEGE